MSIILFESAGLGMIPQHLSIDQATEGPVGLSTGGEPIFDNHQRWRERWGIRIPQPVPTPPVTPQPVPGGALPWWWLRSRYGLPVPPIYSAPSPVDTTLPGVSLPMPVPVAPITPTATLTSSMFATGAPASSSMFAAPSGSGGQIARQSGENALSGLDALSTSEKALTLAGLAALGWFSFAWLKKHSGRRR